MNTFDSIKTPLTWSTTILLAAILAGCGGSSGGGSSQVVSPTLPGAGTGLGGIGRGPAPVVLGTAGNYVILAKSAISAAATAGTMVTGDMGVSPVAATAVTGFGALPLDLTSCYSTSPLVAAPGKIYAADYSTANGCTAVPDTPTLLTAAIGDMLTAYTDAAGRAADYTELGTGNIGGMTLPPATYKWSTGVLIPTDVTLNGGPNDVWIFEIAQGVTQASGAKIIMAGGALPKNVFWQSFGAVDIGTTAHMEGVILSQTSITLKTGASANSRLLAQTAVTLDANTVTQPAP